MSGKKIFFISTSIPYVNAKPHLGHALEFVQADSIARYMREILGVNNVFFLSGTDENSIKNVQSAEKEGIETKDYVEEMGKVFESLLMKLNAKPDYFIKTSADRLHKIGAQKLWSSCKKEDIYKKSYKGLYCEGCEEFKTEKDLVNGECPEHVGKKLVQVEEENYFFKLSNYQKKLEEIIESGELQIIPETRKNEMLSFIRGGLEDFSISRSNARAKNWGIPVPGDDSQMMYVWFDALSNYINALGYGENRTSYVDFWENGETMHVIGKGINRFHSIYWPAMLLSAGVPLPKKVLVHGYITIGGQKMSKSIGNVIDPFEVINEFGADAVRYALLRHIPTFEDGDFTIEKMKEIYNADLVNGIGNLLSRVMKMAVTYGVESSVVTGGDRLNIDKEMSNFELKKVLDNVWAQISITDSFIQKEEPFKKIKTNEEEAKNDIKNLMNELQVFALILKPFMPETSAKIIKCIKENKMPETPLFPRKI